jgi:signal transduction histidine kinase
MTRGQLGLTDRQRETTLLLAIIDAISQGVSLGPLAASVAKLIADATEADVCFVHVLDDTGRSLTLAGATDPFGEQVGRVQLGLGEGVTGWVASRGEPAVILDHKGEDPRYRFIPELRGTDYISMASVPMASERAGLVGVLNVHTRDRREFTDNDIRLLTTIGALIAGAVHAARLHRRLEAREHTHERFAEQVVQAQETERQRIAADIHDGISQRLVSLSFHLDSATRALLEEPASAVSEVRRARALIDEALDEARIAIGALRPPILDDLGLRGGLTSLARSLPPDVTVDLDLSEVRVPEHVEVALYRIAQEALQNIVKHARATSIRIAFRRDEHGVSLTVTDDGAGFDGLAISAGTDSAISYGMTTMSERAELVGGQVQVRSAVGRGTTVSAVVPIGPNASGTGMDSTQPAPDRRSMRPDHR